VFLLFQVSGEQLFADVAKDILLYVSRDLSDKVRLLVCVFVLPVAWGTHGAPGRL